MARTLKAGLTAVLDGGAVYAVIRFTKNASDDWGSGIDYIAAGTIRAESFGADTTVWADSLVDVSEIDNAATPLDDPTAKTSDVRITFDNTAGTIDGADYLGRVVEIGIGYGATMSTATYDVFFTGKVQEAIPNKQDIVFVCRGKGELRDKEIGTPLPDTVNEKYRGKIYPIAYGDWTDDNAFLPVVVTSEYGNAPEIVFDLQPWKSFDSIQLYDPQTETAFETSDTDQFTIGSDNNQLNFYNDTETDLTNGISESANELEVDDYTKISFTDSSGGSAAPQCLLIIDTEMMLVTRDPAEYSGNKVPVERGYGNTTPAVHLAGASIYQVTDTYGSLRIQLSHTFWPQGYSGMLHVADIDPTTQDKNAGEWQNVEENIEGAVDLGKRVEYKHNAFNTPQDTEYEAYVQADMLFESPGISGTVVNQYAMAATRIRTQFTTALGPPAEAYNMLVGSMRIAKDGDHEIYHRFTMTNGSVDPIVGTKYRTTENMYEVTEVGTITGSAPNRTGPVTMKKLYGGEDQSQSDNMTKYYGTGDNIFYHSAWTQVDGALEIDKVYRAAGGDTAELWNNITGVAGEDDRPFGTYNGLTDVSELSSVKYSVIMHISGYNIAAGNVYNSLYAFGIRMDFKTSPIEYDFYVRGEARKDGATLIEAPADVIEDFINTEVPSLSSSDLDSTYLSAFDTDRSAWKLACSINSDMDIS